MFETNGSQIPTRQLKTMDVFVGVGKGAAMEPQTRGFCSQLEEMLTFCRVRKGPCSPLCGPLYCCSQCIFPIRTHFPFSILKPQLLWCHSYCGIVAAILAVPLCFRENASASGSRGGSQSNSLGTTVGCDSTNHKLFRFHCVSEKMRVK